MKINELIRYLKQVAHRHGNVDISNMGRNGEAIDLEKRHIFLLTTKNFGITKPGKDYKLIIDPENGNKEDKSEPTCLEEGVINNDPALKPMGYN